MAARDFQPLKTLLPGVLSRVAREGGTARGLGPVWEEAAGPVIARHARPLSFEGGELVFGVAHPRWIQELEAQKPELLARLSDMLGPSAPKALHFRTRP